MNLKMKVAAALVAVPCLAVATGAGEASAYAGDQIYNCGVGAGQTGYTGSCASSGYSITVLRSDGFQQDVSPGRYSPTNLKAFYVPGCFKARNLQSGYTYGAGWHYFAWGNALLILQEYYQGWC